VIGVLVVLLALAGLFVLVLLLVLVGVVAYLFLRHQDRGSG
jgi:cbb3-type cytochrome oxidase subunit 3